MAETTGLAEMKKQFLDLAGVEVPAKISPEGALASAKRIVELEEKIALGTQDPIDLVPALISTSQLLKFWEQKNPSHVIGQPFPVQDTGEVKRISEKLKGEILPVGEIKDLMARLYVADPELGTKKSMEVLTILHEKYPNAPLKPTEE